MKKRIGAIIMASALSVTIAGMGAGAAATNTATESIQSTTVVENLTKGRTLLLPDSAFICYLGEGKVIVKSGSSLNVRSGPGTNYSIRGKLKRGAAVSLYCTTKDKDGWTYIIADSVDGFVSSQYIGNIDPASVTEES